MRAIVRTLLIITVGLLGMPSRSDASELEGGGWWGDWVDNNSGHTGPLRARFRSTRDGNYRAVFTGTYRKVIPFVFAVKLNVAERDGERVILAGESRLPLFGRFSYEGVGDAHQFDMQYHSRRWSGNFQLSR